MDLELDRNKLNALENYQDFVKYNVQQLFENSSQYASLKQSEGYVYWGYDAERLRMQNYVPNNIADISIEDINHRDRSFGIAHFAALRELRTQLPEFIPTALVELGIGEDASLVSNAVDMYASSLREIILIDIDESKAHTANETVRALLDERQLLNQIEVTTYIGPAHETIPRIQFQGEGVTLWNAQLFFEHLINQGEPSPMELTWNALAAKMTEHDKLLAGMIWYDLWDQQAGYEEIIPMFREFGWRLRGATDYSDLTHFVADIETYAPTLTAEVFYETPIIIKGLDYRMGAVLSDLPVRVYQNVLAAHRRMPERVSAMDIIELLEAMQRFMINLLEGVPLPITMSHVLIKKTPEMKQNGRL